MKNTGPTRQAAVLALAQVRGLWRACYGPGKEDAMCLKKGKLLTGLFSRPRLTQNTTFLVSPSHESPLQEVVFFR